MPLRELKEGEEVYVAFVDKSITLKMPVSMQQSLNEKIVSAIDYRNLRNIDRENFQSFNAEEIEAVAKAIERIVLLEIKEALRVGVNIGMGNVEQPRFEGDFNFNQKKSIKECKDYIEQLTRIK